MDNDGSSDSALEFESPARRRIAYATRSSLGYDNRPSTSRAAAVARLAGRQVRAIDQSNVGSSSRVSAAPANPNTDRTLKGAARRKMSYRQRQLKDLKAIAKLQQSTKLQIPKAPFARVIREITMQCQPEITRYTLTAIEALHEATEMFLTQVFQDAYILTLHRKCVTLAVQDIKLLRALKLNI